MLSKVSVTVSYIICAFSPRWCHVQLRLRVRLRVPTFGSHRAFKKLGEWDNTDCARAATTGWQWMMNVLNSSFCCNNEPFMIVPMFYARSMRGGFIFRNQGPLLKLPMWGFTESCCDVASTSCPVLNSRHVTFEKPPFDTQHFCDSTSTLLIYINKKNWQEKFFPGILRTAKRILTNLYKPQGLRASQDFDKTLKIVRSFLLLCMRNSTWNADVVWK